MESSRRAPSWKRFVATTLDLISSFFAFGYAIGAATGNMTSKGFSLEGGPALLLFALIAAYFVVGRKFAGGTLWDRVFGIRRPQPG